MLPRNIHHKSGQFRVELRLLHKLVKVFDSKTTREFNFAGELSTSNSQQRAGILIGLGSPLAPQALPRALAFQTAG